MHTHYRRGARRPAPRAQAERIRATPHTVTQRIASATIAESIFDTPRRRSGNTIGTSRILPPAAATRLVISIWKTYPFACTERKSKLRSISALYARNPAVMSCTPTPNISRAYHEPHREIRSRYHGQPSVRPPGTRREPITRSTPRSHRITRSIRAKSCGRCDPSISISHTTSYPRSSAHVKPAKYAGPNPPLPLRCTTWIWPLSRAIRSASSPVPSGEPSSTTSTSTPGLYANTPSSVVRRFSRSLYVGITTHTLPPTGAANSADAAMLPLSQRSGLRLCITVPVFVANTLTTVPQYEV